MTETQDADEALMGRFVSMGGNCEFGIAQRQRGAEPLDLLRWANTGMGVLLKLLEDRFARLGDADVTRVVVHGKQYGVQNDHYRLSWHSWVGVDEMSPERLLRRELLRMPRQAEMLLEVMAEGRRILLRKADNQTSTAGLERLVSLVGGLGPSPILFVVADAARPVSVERAGPTLVRGTLPAFADAANVMADTRAAPWVELCRKATELLDAPAGA